MTVNPTPSENAIKTRAFFKKTDILVVAIILLVGVGAWLAYRRFTADKPAVAEIYYGSELVQTVDLSTGENRTFSVPQDEHVIFHLYSDGSIAFESSDCPDKVCVRSGRLRRVGESAACLPNQLILKIVAAQRDDGDLDIIA